MGEEGQGTGGDVGAGGCGDVVVAESCFALWFKSCSAL